MHPIVERPRPQINGPTCSAIPDVLVQSRLPIQHPRDDGQVDATEGREEPNLGRPALARPVGRKLPQLEQPPQHPTLGNQKRPQQRRCQMDGILGRPAWKRPIGLQLGHYPTVFLWQLLQWVTL